MALPAFLQGTFIKPHSQQKLQEKVLKCLELVDASPEQAYVKSLLHGHLDKIIVQKKWSLENVQTREEKHL